MEEPNIYRSLLVFVGELQVSGMLLNVNLNVIFSKAVRESTIRGGLLGSRGSRQVVACFRQSWQDLSSEFGCCNVVQVEQMSWIWNYSDEALTCLQRDCCLCAGVYLLHLVCVASEVFFYIGTAPHECPSSGHSTTVLLIRSFPPHVTR